MDLFKQIRSYFGTKPSLQDQTRSFFPNQLKPYGNLNQSLLTSYAHITGRKPLLAADVASRQANYYLRTSPAVTAFVREVVNNSVGTQLGSLQSKISGLSPEENARLNSLIETKWIDFTSKPENFDLSGRFDITEFLSMAVSNYIIEGEVNVRIFGAGKYKYKYQLLDFASLDYTIQRGNTFYGVSIDGFTAPISYWLVDSSEQKFEIPAREFIHFGHYLNVADYRGYSLISPGFDALDKINSFESATVNAAINEATKVIYYRTTDAYSKTYEGAGSAADIAAFNPNATDTATASGYDPSAVLAGSGVLAGGIAVESLPAGVEMGQLAANHPGGSFVDADRLLYKILGSAFGIPMASLMLDLSEANYSSMQAGELFKRPVFRKISRLMVKKFLEPVFENFMNSLIASDKKNFPKVDGSYDVYKQPTFPLPKFSFVNPVDGINAEILAVQNDMRLWSDLLADMGWDFEDFLRQKKLDQELMAQIGVSLKTAQDKDLTLEYFKTNSVNTSKPSKAKDPNAKSN